MTIGLENYSVFGKFYDFLHNTRNVTKGGKGPQFRGRRITVGAKKSQECPRHFFQNSNLHLFPKDLRLEHGRAKRFSCTRRHLTSLPRYAPAHHDCLVEMAKFVYKNTCPSVANYQSQAI